MKLKIHVLVANILKLCGVKSHFYNILFLFYASSTSSLCVVAVELKRESFMGLMVKWGAIINCTLVF